MIGIVVSCDYPLCPEQRELLPKVGPWAELEVYVLGDTFGVESAGTLKLPEGWSMRDDGHCRCPAHLHAHVVEP